MIERWLYSRPHAAGGAGGAIRRNNNQMIDIRKLKELVRLMVANDLTELDLRDSEEQVTLRREGPGAPAVMAQPVQHMQMPATAPAAPSAPAPAAADAPAADDGLVAVESPMVGTFYSAPDPDSAAFVNVGDSVGTGTVVCLIEAMKIFNEIKADQSGKVAKVCVKNGESVEFGQPLFMIKPE